MRQLLILLLALGSVMSTVTATAQEPARMALLIGNQNYNQKVGPLKNPRKDVDIIAASLTKLGFKVTVLKDADYKTMETALKRYVSEVRRAGRGALSGAAIPGAPSARVGGSRPGPRYAGASRRAPQR